MATTEYAHPEVLVETDCVAQHLNDAQIRYVEVDVDTTMYDAGHIPGARNIPWSLAVQENGTFKPPEALRQLYEAQGITADKDVVAYCRIGERLSHTRVVLKYLLGYPKVSNYDGSWTEWGSSIGVPIEKP